MESEVVFLDTSILIDYFRKKDKSKSVFVRLMKQHNLFATSAITEFEIFTGNKGAADDEIWDLFFQQITVLPFDSETSRIAVNIDKQLKKKRKAISIQDLFIGATALRHNLKLATLNVSHFERIEGLQLVNLK